MSRTEVPVVELHPSYRSVWQGYPTSFQCIAAAGWPIGPLEFSINGRDIDTMSNVSVDCLTTANCTLLISRAIAGQDNGTISCCLDNTVGEDCKTAQLDIKRELQHCIDFHDLIYDYSRLFLILKSVLS